QEGDHAADVIRHAESLERVPRGDLVLAALVEGAGEAGLDDGGGDAVDADVGAELHRQSLGQADERGLAGAVHRDARRGLQPGHRGDVDYRSAVLPHPGGVDGLHPGQGGDRVGVEDLAGRVEVEVDEGAVGGVDPGVVDQQVDAAEGLQRPGDDLVAVVGVA